MEKLEDEKIMSSVSCQHSPHQKGSSEYDADCAREDESKRKRKRKSILLVQRKGIKKMKERVTFISTFNAIKNRDN